MCIRDSIIINALKRARHTIQPPGMVFIAGKTVWSMPEHFKVVCVPCKALYKCSALLFLHDMSPSQTANLYTVEKVIDGSRSDSEGHTDAVQTYTGYGLWNASTSSWLCSFTDACMVWHRGIFSTTSRTSPIPTAAISSHRHPHS